MLNMLDEDANVCQTTDGLVPDEYLGLHRFKRAGIDGARELLIKRLKDQVFLSRISLQLRRERELSMMPSSPNCDTFWRSRRRHN